MDPAGDLTGIQLDDRDSILLRDVGVDLALDVLQLIQVFDGFAAVEYGEVARLGEVSGSRNRSFEEPCS